MRLSVWFTFSLGTAIATSHVIPEVPLVNQSDANPLVTQLLGKRKEDSVISLDFVKRWAAIGDSFTAGIGSGKQMGSPVSSGDDWKCSRYTYTWPHIVNRRLGKAVANFQYPACSGARTGEIYEQARDLSGNLDVVMLTAGGNDLCLSAMIKTCVILPYEGEDACTKLINKAQENIDTIIKDNIRDILDALKSKMKTGGIVIFSGYAPFFNTKNEDCAKKQQWAWKSYKSWRYWLNKGLDLTVDRRKKFNSLVANINRATREVVEEYQKDRSVKYDIEFSDWSEWPAEVDGQMCSPSSDGSYPDKNQPEMMFIKEDTWIRDPTHRDSLRRIRRREGDEDDDDELPTDLDLSANEAVQNIDIYNTLLFKSPDPRAVARRRLDPRAPTPPGCPSSVWDPVAEVGMPDSILRNFHPNEKGHEVIAAFALANLAFAKAKQDGKVGQVCEIGTDKFTCWQKEGYKAFVSWDRLDKNYKDFCAQVEPPKDTINWENKMTYYEGTPEEFELRIKLSNGASEFDEKQCLESFDRIINSCDGNDPNNPLNWKFGGEWVRGSYKYQINPQKVREMIGWTDGRCGSWYKATHSEYIIYGSGWAGWDYGQQTLLPSIKKCVGKGVTAWKFEYYSSPSDKNGWEWRAHFNTPVWTRARCFNNLKVQKGAGGYTHKWKDNQAEESYEDRGCMGSFT